MRTQAGWSEKLQIEHSDVLDPGGAWRSDRGCPLPAILIASLTVAERRRLLSKLETDERNLLKHSWRGWGARHDQLTPTGKWFVWLALAGRGWGKTKTGAEWTEETALANPGIWIALISETPGKARDDMIEGPAGLLNTERCRYDPKWKPVYEPSKRRLTYPNGSYCTIYSGAHPEQIRGFSGRGGVVR